MKKYKSQTDNKGTTIILDSAEDAINRTREFLKSPEFDGMFKANHWYGEDKIGEYKSNLNKSFESCCSDLISPKKGFKEQVEEIIDSLQGLVDDMNPQFSQNSFELETAEEGHAVSMELAVQGEENFCFKDKVNPELELKKGTSGEGAYRILINTDVSWWGTPQDNVALVACLIILLQRYAPVEVWVQQGWLGAAEEDGVTLFKLDYTLSLDLNNLAFWIAHPGKDSPFSYLVNKALGRKSTATSCRAEIESDIMLRGDWFSMFKINFAKVSSSLHTERQEMMAKWIAGTCYKIITGQNPEDKEWFKGIE